MDDLPDVLIHEIVSKFDSYSAFLRASTLSKRWYSVLASFPFLDFSEPLFLASLNSEAPEPLDSAENVEKFIKYVEYRLSTFTDQSLTAFKLASFFKRSVDFSLLDKWIRVVLDKDVRDLELTDLRLVRAFNSTGTEEFMDAFEHPYCLPKEIFSSESLRSLTVCCHCELSTSVPDGVNCNFLKVLNLTWVKIDEDVIRFFISSCPLMEKFEFYLCYGFKKFFVFGLEKLQVAGCNFLNEVETVDIQGQNLEFVWLTSFETNTVLPHIKVDLCNNLKRLALEVKFRMIWLSKLISKFPVLEDVYLKNRSFLEKSFQVSSHSLRKFELHLRGSQNLERIVIDAPNLRLFLFCGDLHPLLLFSLTSIWAKCICCMHWEIESSGHWFIDLREFLDRTKQFKVLKLHIPVQNVRFEDLNAIRSQPPHELEHLELKMKDMSYGFIDVIEAVFASCHPQSLTLIWNHEISVFEGNKSFVECLHLKLIEQLDGGQEELQMVVGGGSTFEREFLSMKALLDALSSLEGGQEITFRKAH